MMVALDSPNALAARTYSKFLARRNSARTTPTSDTHEKRSRMPSRMKKLGVMIDEMMIRR
jgi:hypothetical protein